MLPHSVVLGMGALVGRLACAILPGKRRRIRENLARAGAPDPAAASWRSGAHVGRTMAEMSWLLSQSPERIDSVMDIHGLDVLREAAAKGRGVLMISAHIGDWELSAQAAGRSGTPVHAVARHLGSPRVEDAIARFRASGGVRTIVRGVGGSSIAAYRALRNGHVLACMMDRMSSGRRACVPLLGAHVKIPYGPLILARRAGAAIVFVGAARRGDGLTDIRFHALPDAADGVAEEAIESLAVRVGHEIDTLVRRAPEQWYWIYRRPMRPPVRQAPEAADATLAIAGAA